MNTKDAGKRIKMILEYYKITASSFAERIEVQRSSISHILSGRNNPSLDLIYKIIDNFPEINPMWLIAGKGTMRQLDLFENEDLLEARPRIANGEDFDSYGSADFFQEQINNPPLLKTQVHTKKKRGSKTETYPFQTSLPFEKNTSEEKQIEKIMIFYTDKTFSCYKPEL